MTYLYIKAFHLFFVVAWFAGLFYLPRIFVNLAMATEASELARLQLMANKLYRFMTPLAGIALALGLVLWLGYGVSGGWLHAKLLLVALMLAQFIVCGRWLKGVEQGRALPSPRTLRLVNELPVLALLLVIWLVLAKPF